MTASIAEEVNSELYRKLKLHLQKSKDKDIANFNLNQDFSKKGIMMINGSFSV